MKWKATLFTLSFDERKTCSDKKDYRWPWPPPLRAISNNTAKPPCLRSKDGLGLGEMEFLGHNKSTIWMPSPPKTLGFRHTLVNICNIY